MSEQRIVTTAPIGKTAIDILEQIAPAVIASAPDEQTLLSLVDRTIGIVSRGIEGRVTKRVIEACSQLRVIGRPGSGYDTVDVTAATARGVPVVYVPVGGFAVAEGALAMLLALVKKIPICDRVVHEGQWQRRYELTTGDMAEHTLGVVGLGHIGAHFARLAQPFGMTILGFDPLFSSAPEDLKFVQMVPLADLLARSDYVSLHVPLSPQSRGLFNRERIAQMKPGAVIINTARGGVIESLEVLAEGLESGQLGGLGLDVFPAEPPDVSHRIFRDPRLLCAPHLLGVSDLAMERIYRSMANDMVAVLRQGRPRFCVNPETLRGRIGVPG